MDQAANSGALRTLIPVFSMTPISWCKSSFLTVGLALAFALPAPPASAQDFQNWRTVGADQWPDAGNAIPPRAVLGSVSVDPSLRSAVEKLDDASFAAREEATQSILSSEIDRNQIYAMLEFEPLSAEQRYRLLAVVREMLTRMPRGALGISMRPIQFGVAGPVEIRVEDLIPGLPAERVLRIGDGIVAFDGKPLVTQADLQIRIQSKKPGEKAILTIKRARVDEEGQHVLDANNQIQFDTMDVEIELGSAELLRSSTVNNPGFDRESALERYRQREAAEVAQQYAPKPREIPVKGSLVAASLQSEPGFGRTAAPFRLRDVDDHPLIRNLIEERTMIAQGQRKLTPALRQQWLQNLKSLMLLAQKEQQVEERAYLEEVIARYAELLGE